jgi:hypothetical protein
MTKSIYDKTEDGYDVFVPMYSQYTTAVPKLRLELAAETPPSVNFSPNALLETMVLPHRRFGRIVALNNTPRVHLATCQLQAIFQLGLSAKIALGTAS